MVGGGIVGLATATALLDLSPGFRLTLLEKEGEVGRHQSSHNSGVLHAGVAYSPGSEKARLVRRGLRLMVEFCESHAIPYERCGKLVVASETAQLPGLRSLMERCVVNGLQGVRLLSAEAAREIEPHVASVGALHIPEEGITDFGAVCRCLAEDLVNRGVDLRTSEEVRFIQRRQGTWIVQTSGAEHSCDFLINCAGLQVDRVLTLTGETPPCRIVPFRGEYYRLREERRRLVRHLVYPLPEPGFPFLGAHFTRRIGGAVDAGPNAVLAWAREGYSKGDVRFRDLVESVTFTGLWRFARAHPRRVATELAESLSKRRYVRKLQQLIPELREADLVPGPAGVRAQAMRAGGELVQDFLLFEAPGAVHALNVPSPAATASLAIGEELARRTLRQLHTN